MRPVATALVLTAFVVAACGGGDTLTGAGATPLAKSPKGKTGLKLVKVGSFDQPVYVTAPPSDKTRVFVVEQAGRIQVRKDGKTSTFLDIHDLVTSGGEQGLLSMAFAPDYATSKKFYVYYTDKDSMQRVVEYTAASAGRADPGSARLVLKMADPESNHNGGLLLFGPDGHLYIGTGDGGGAGDRHGAHGNGQDKTSLLGKLLRIDPAQKGGAAYTVPGDNPFSGTGERREIYAYGLRNPWRFSFDRKTGDLAIGDVGQDAYEEIDFVHKGRGLGKNFGWRVYEGTSQYNTSETASGTTKPVIVTKHSAGNCSITGGVVVRDKAVPGAYGRYLYGDYCRGEILSAKLKLPKTTSVRGTGLKVEALSSFGEDARGRVYAVSNNGPVYRLAAR